MGDSRAPGVGSAGEQSDRECACKLGRSCRSRGLDDVDDTLRRRHADGASLRDLERVVNEAIAERTLRDADATVIGDAGAAYDLLSGDGSAGERTALRGRLERAGVDVEALESDLVSYQTVRTHLRECLDVDTGRETELEPDDALDTVEWARSRCEGVVERTLERLERDDALAAGDLDVAATVRVTCRDCGASATVGSFVDGAGCDCDSSERGAPFGDGSGVDDGVGYGGSAADRAGNGDSDTRER